jgi:hypothetical protein
MAHLYYSPPSIKDCGFLPSGNLYAAAADAPEVESESRFHRMMAERLASDFPGQDRL